ncbi:MAG: protein tyrosine phosphatase [candidate division WS1 bacterium]|jgi:atypical dual specificity phosphatase|nr:protein tyrosine phosphatase [candidate division WS1 bacterium]
MGAMAGDSGWLNRVSWIIEGEIAAFSAFVLRDLDALAEMGICGIVSLTEDSPIELVGEGTRFRLLHIPVTDMTPPDSDQIARFVSFVETLVDEGCAVGVHCLAGLGRTGTMIACYLVSEGHGADEAIAMVRRARPGSIQTEEQEQAIRRWERSQRGGSAMAEFL